MGQAFVLVSTGSLFMLNGLNTIDVGTLVYCGNKCTKAWIFHQNPAMEEWPLFKDP